MREDVDPAMMTGCLWGCAMGDALGLPYENLSPKRIGKWLGDKPLHHRFFLGWGMVSDDTEHSLIVARCLLRHLGDPEGFERALAGEFKYWIAGIPVGIGLATARSILKLWLGVSPKQSGVFSAGNGPAMRSAIIGTLIPDDEELRRSFTIRSTQITHTDPKASHGALAVAEIAARLARKEWQSRPEVDKVESLLSSLADTNEWQGIVQVTTLTLGGEISLEDFAASLGGPRGVTGYVYHTVPYAIACWYLNFGNFEKTIENTIRGGGDTDSTAAIAGALAGLTCYQSGKIPSGWKERILLWPLRSESFQNSGVKPAPLLKVWLRNIFFFLVILVHLIRRAFPPFG